MGMVKSSEALPQPVVRFSLRDIESEARAALDRAAEQSESMLADARARAGEIETEARAHAVCDGHAEGLEQGLNEGRRHAIEQYAGEISTLLHTLTRSIEEVCAARERLQSEALREVVELAIGIARRVTKRQAQIDPDVLVANLKDALALTGRTSELRVAVHPSQRRVLAEALPLLRAEWPTLMESSIIEDPSLSVGGCRVFTQHGRIDADIDAQLDRVIADLLPDTDAEQAA